MASRPLGLDENETQNVCAAAEAIATQRAARLAERLNAAAANTMDFRGDFLVRRVDGVDVRLHPGSSKEYGLKTGRLEDWMQGHESVAPGKPRLPRPNAPPARDTALDVAKLLAMASPPAHQAASGRPALAATQGKRRRGQNGDVGLADIEANSVLEMSGRLPALGTGGGDPGGARRGRKARRRRVGLGPRRRGRGKGWASTGSAM